MHRHRHLTTPFTNSFPIRRVPMAMAGRGTTSMTSIDGRRSPSWRNRRVHPAGRPPLPFENLDGSNFRADLPVDSEGIVASTTPNFSANRFTTLTGAVPGSTLFKFRTGYPRHMGWFVLILLFIAVCAGACRHLAWAPDWRAGAKRRAGDRRRSQKIPFRHGGSRWRSRAAPRVHVHRTGWRYLSPRRFGHYQPVGGARGGRCYRVCSVSRMIPGSVRPLGSFSMRAMRWRSAYRVKFVVND